MLAAELALPEEEEAVKFTVTGGRRGGLGMERTLVLHGKNKKNQKYIVCCLKVEFN